MASLQVSKQSKNIAVLDLGTNSARLFIFDIVTSRTPALIYRKKISVRLGEEVFATGLLSARAMKRTTKALCAFKKKIDRFGPLTVHAATTSAVRSAKNGKLFLESLQRDLGLQFQVLSGEREAEYIAAGVSLEVAPHERAVVIDIGGGSTEIAQLYNNKISGCCSLPIGALRGFEIYLKTLPPKPVAAEELRRQIRSLLEKHKVSAALKHDVCIGTSGTIKALQKIYEARYKTNSPMTASFISGFIEEIQPLNEVQLLAIKGLKPKRTRIILAGAVILDEVVRHLGAGSIRFVERALSDGIAVVSAKNAK